MRDMDELCHEKVSSVCKPAILWQDIYPDSSPYLVMFLPLYQYRDDMVVN
jgi:hypothetical protein